MMRTSWEKKAISIEEEIEESFKDKKLQRNLMNHAFSFTKDTDEAKDLVQEARIKVWKKKEKVHRKNPQGFLMRIIRNMYASDYRKKQKQPTVRITEDWEREKLIQTTGEENNDESNYSNVMQTAINNLQEVLRVPMQLLIQEYSYKEIEEEIDIPMGTIKGRIFRAKRKLKKILENNES